ncbi:MAG: phosphotransferase [Pirellulaceae bacterium]
MNSAIEFARQRIQDHLCAAGHQINSCWYSLRHEPHSEHQFVEFRFGQDHGPPLRIFSKLLTSGGGQTAYGAQRWLDSRLAAHNVLAVPRPILYDSQHGTFAMQQVQGRDVRQIHRSPTATEDIRRIGLALATLHNLPSPNLPPKTMVDHLNELVRPHPISLAARLPGYRPNSAHLASWLAATAERHTFVATPMHRDFRFPADLVARSTSLCVGLGHVCRRRSRV